MNDDRDRTVPEKQEPSASPSDPAEFDQFASGYGAGMENPAKRMVGRSADDFILPKVQWMLRDLEARPIRGAHVAELRLLDFGCGTAPFLRNLRKQGFPGHLRGCDVSQGMLDEAARTWDTDSGQSLDLVPEDGGEWPYHDASFELIVLSGVLHHVPVEARDELLGRIVRLLVPNGRLYVFEHNVLHPLTRWVVHRTKIDRNAVLLSSREVRYRLRDAGLPISLTSYLLFVPPRWTWLRPVETWLRWMPMGGQFVVVGHR